MLKRPVGALAIACAAIDDVTAWFLIALATTIARRRHASATWSRRSALAVAFCAPDGLRRPARSSAAWRPPTTRSAGSRSGGSRRSSSACCCRRTSPRTIGIAFIFGAFIMGMIMPRHARLTEDVTRRHRGLRRHAAAAAVLRATPACGPTCGLLDRPELWLLTLAADRDRDRRQAGGAMIAARVAGLDWRASAVIGTLMNTRGLTELIVLNLALEKGVDLRRAVRDARDHGARHDAHGRAAAEAARPEATSTARRSRRSSRTRASASPGLPALQIPERSILVAPQTDAALAAAASRWPSRWRARPRRAS